MTSLSKTMKSFFSPKSKKKQNPNPTSPKSVLRSPTAIDWRSSSASSLSSDLRAPPRFSPSELAQVLLHLGGGPEDAAEVAAVLDGDALLDPDEDELRMVFAVFDRDGDGRISAEELCGVFAMMGDVATSVEDCRRMIGGVDSDGDGFVSFGDFARMMAVDGRI